MIDCCLEVVFYEQADGSALWAHARKTIACCGGSTELGPRLRGDDGVFVYSIRRAIENIKTLIFTAFSSDKSPKTPAQQRL
jgi:hypothetical protein